MRPDLVVDEGGAIVSGMIPAVSGELAMIGVAEKGIANFRLTARDHAGHASAPEKNGAAVRLARAIVRTGPEPFPGPLEPGHHRNGQDTGRSNAEVARTRRLRTDHPTVDSAVLDQVGWPGGCACPHDRRR